MISTNHQHLRKVGRKLQVVSRVNGEGEHAGARKRSSAGRTERAGSGSPRSHQVLVKCSTEFTLRGIIAASEQQPFDCLYYVPSEMIREMFCFELSRLSQGKRARSDASLQGGRNPPQKPSGVLRGLSSCFVPTPRFFLRLLPGCFPRPGQLREGWNTAGLCTGGPRGRGSVCSPRPTGVPSCACWLVSAERD